MAKQTDEKVESHSGTIEVRSIPVASVSVSAERRATAKETVVASLMGSLERRGLLSPIRVRADGGLVCGLHRLIAHERLGWASIDALVCDGSDPVEVELDEIEENLCRKDLTVLERARDEFRQKELYLIRNPTTRQGIAGAVARHEGVQAKHVSFADRRAIETGASKRMVEQRVQIATTLGDEGVAKLASRPIADNHRQLLELARLPDSIRNDVVDRIADGRAQKVKQAVGQVTSPEPGSRIDRSRQAEGLLVQTDTGYRGEAILNGRRVTIEFGHDHRAMSVADEGAVVIEVLRSDTRRLTVELSFALVHEVIDELPSDLARSVRASDVVDDPTLSCASCGGLWFLRDAPDCCASCNRHSDVILADIIDATFSREHPRKRQLITVQHDDRSAERTLEIVWSRGELNRSTVLLAAVRGWAPDSIPEWQTDVEFNAAACRWRGSIDTFLSPSTDGFKKALRSAVLRVLKTTHKLQQRGERFFRADGTEVTMVRHIG